MDLIRRNLLEEVNDRENSMNAISHRNGKYQGTAPRAKGKWISQIRINGISIKLGLFNSEREACIAYCRYCLEHSLARREFMPLEFTDEELGIVK